MSTTTTEKTLRSVAQGDTPVLERLVSMNLDSLEKSKLDPVTYHLVRLAALVAMEAAPVSYLINLELAGEAGMTIEQAQNTLIAIAPIVGSARVAAAAGNVLRAYGIRVALEEES